MTSTPNNRLSTIDSLRGIAAFAVAIYHIDLVTLANSTALGNWLHQFFQFGYLGVSVFFVISGFVIAASTSNDVITFKYFGKFLVKRQTRLDPNYWASITLDIVLSVIAVRFLAINTPIPNLESIAAHMLYLQEFLGIRQIAAIYWTLCLEIQFYIVFCLVLAIDTTYRRNRPLSELNLKMWLLAAITLYSLLICAEILPSPMRGIFIPYWILFCMGAAAFHWGIRRQDNNWAFPLLLFGAILACIYQIKVKGLSYSLSLGLACTTAAFLFIGARRSKLGSLFNNSVLQYLGSRSYSIYLFHTIVGERSAGVMTKIIYPRLQLSPSEPIWAMVAFIVGLAASLAIAEIAFRLIETPSLQLCKRVKPNQPKSALKELFSPPFRKAEYTVSR